MQPSTFIGLDVHKATISVAVALGERGGEVRHWGTIPHRPDHVRKLVEKLGAGGRRLHFCYEAGPCSYGLYRQLVELGHDYIVMAPSLIPVKAGDRVKTDRRDATILAKLHRAGELTAVWVKILLHATDQLTETELRAAVTSVHEDFDRIYETRRTMFHWKLSTKFILTAINGAGTVFVFILGGILVLEGRTDVGTVVAANLGLSRLQDPTAFLIAFYREVSANRVKFELLRSLPLGQPVAST